MILIEHRIHYLCLSCLRPLPRKLQHASGDVDHTYEVEDELGILFYGGPLLYRPRKKGKFKWMWNGDHLWAVHGIVSSTLMCITFDEIMNVLTYLGM